MKNEFNDREDLVTDVSMLFFDAYTDLKNSLTKVFKNFTKHEKHNVENGGINVWIAERAIRKKFWVQLGTGIPLSVCTLSNHKNWWYRKTNQNSTFSLVWPILMNIIERGIFHQQSSRVVTKKLNKTSIKQNFASNNFCWKHFLLNIIVLNISEKKNQWGTNPHHKRSSIPISFGLLFSWHSRDPYERFLLKSSLLSKNFFQFLLVFKGIESKNKILQSWFLA